MKAKSVIEPTVSIAELETAHADAVEEGRTAARQVDELQRQLRVAKREAAFRAIRLASEGLDDSDVALAQANNECGVTHLTHALTNAVKSKVDAPAAAQGWLDRLNAQREQAYAVLMDAAEKDRRALQDELLDLIVPLIDARLARANAIAASTEEARALAHHIGPQREAAHVARLGIFWHGAPSPRIVLLWLVEILKRRGQ